MKYRFKLIADEIEFIRQEIQNFNHLFQTDISICRVDEEDILIIELESSMSDDLLFEFGTRLGFNHQFQSLHNHL